MSYTSPKYTYISQQPAFNKLQDDISGATKTIADKREKQRLANEKEIALGSGATQKYVNDSVSQNTVGSQSAQGAIERLTKGTGKRVGELTIATQGANAQCHTDGNCEELMRELAYLEQSPDDIKAFTENMISQLDYKDIKNFDPNQPGSFMTAANVLEGSDMRTPAYGFTYDIKYNGEGSYDWVFSFDRNKAKAELGDPPKDPQTGKEIEDVDAFLDDMSFEGKDEFVINNKGLSDKQDIFVKTPEISTDINEVLKDTQLFGGIKFDDNGELVPGTGKFDMTRFVSGYKPYQEVSGKSDKTFTGYEVVVDKNLIAEDRALNIQLDRKFAEYSKNENSGEMTALWNMTLSGHSYDWDQNEIAKEMGFKTPEDMQQAWDYGDVTDQMKKVFKKYYKQYVVDDIASTMNSPAFFDYRTSHEARRHALQNPHLIQTEIDTDLELQNQGNDDEDKEDDIDAENF